MQNQHLFCWVWSRVLQPTLVDSHNPYSRNHPEQQLIEALFAGVAGPLFEESRTHATQAGLLGVRVRLHIQAPEVAGLPWEYLFDPRQEEYLCLSRTTPVVRSPELAQPLSSRSSSRRRCASWE